MRTAVLRIDIDPGRELTAGQRADGLATLRPELSGLGAELVGGPSRPVAVGTHRELPSTEPAADRGSAGPSGENDPPRELEILLDTDDAVTASSALVELCAKIFGTTPAPGVVTFVSRGTDDDVHGVLAGFGLRGEVTRSLDDDGFDIVHVRLREDDLRRVPESRVHTALEASLNCEVRIDIH